MDKVYVVSDGDYEDYCVLGLYLTEAEAELAAVYFNTDRIEEWTIDKPPSFPAGCKYYAVAVNPHETVTSANITRKVRASHYRTFMPQNPTKMAWICHWAVDEAEAREKAEQTRQDIVSAGLWPESWADYTEKRKQGAYDD